MNSRIIEWGLLAFRLVIGGVFVYASIGKILNPSDFAAVVYQYGVLPGFLVNAVAVFLPWMELAAGAFLIGGLWTRSAAFWINVMLVVFIVAISYNLAIGREINCGCFTQSLDAEAASNPWEVLIRDVIMLAGAVALQIRGNSLLSIDGWLSGRSLDRAAAAV